METHCGGVLRGAVGSSRVKVCQVRYRTDKNHNLPKVQLQVQLIRFYASYANSILCTKYLECLILTLAPLLLRPLTCTMRRKEIVRNWRSATAAVWRVHLSV